MKALRITLFLILLPLVLWGQEIDDNILENKYYKQKIAEFKANPIGKSQIVFFGNSIIEGGKWQTYFPTQPIVNRGISGDNTDGMLARVHEIIIAKPAKVFVLIGINDVSLQRSNDVILRQTRMLIRQLLAGSPDTKIYVHSILPLNDDKLKYKRLQGKNQQVIDYNSELKKLCDEMGLTYIDIYSQLKQTATAQLNPGYTADGLHINKEGYRVWAAYIRKHIEQ